jgi:non-homologous end joining protein Ku
MANAAARASTLTTLAIGQVELTVGLFATQDKPGKLQEFVTAGPHGGELRTEYRRAAEQPVDFEVVSDPLADDSDDDNPEPWPSITQEGADVIASYESESVPVVSVLVEDGYGDIEPEQVRKGVRREDGAFVDCTDRLQQIVDVTKLDRMEVVKFVDITKVPRARVKNAYYVGTGEQGDKKTPLALKLLLEALKCERRGAVVKLTKTTRQTVGVIGWSGDSLMLYELVFSEDFRPAPKRAELGKVDVQPAQVEMMRELVRAMSGTVEYLDELRDDAIALREELYAAALSENPGDMSAVAAAIESAVESEDSIFDQLAASLAVA